MSHSYISCLVHVVFSTVERQPLIPGQAAKTSSAYIGGIARENGMAALAVGWCLRSYSRTTVAVTNGPLWPKAVNCSKRIFESGVKDAYPELKGFAWQEDTPPSPSGFPTSKNGRVYSWPGRHHKRASFAEELSKFLAAHGIAQE